MERQIVPVSQQWYRDLCEEVSEIWGTQNMHIAEMIIRRNLLIAERVSTSSLEHNIPVADLVPQLALDLKLHKRKVWEFKQGYDHYVLEEGKTVDELVTTHPNWTAMVRELPKQFTREIKETPEEREAMLKTQAFDLKQKLRKKHKDHYEEFISYFKQLI